MPGLPKHLVQELNVGTVPKCNTYPFVLISPHICEIYGMPLIHFSLKENHFSLKKNKHHFSLKKNYFSLKKNYFYLKKNHFYLKKNSE